MKDKQLLILDRLSNSSRKSEFFDELKLFFNEHYSDLFFELIEVIPYPPYYIPISESQNIDSIMKEFSSSNKAIAKNNFIIVNNYMVYPIFNNNKYPNILLVFNNQINKNLDEINELCGLIKNIYKIANINFYSGFEESDLKNANLISQISHDVNSMISILKSKLSKIDTPVLEKMNYTEQMTKDILQYVREIEVLASEVNILELLNSIIQNVSIPENIHVIENYELDTEIIKVDVELINRAIGEIIKNSIFALDDESGKINITAEVKKLQSLFIQNDFLKITIEDNGKGINPDFKEFVTNPFFTTKKSDYHSGLGLSIAKKIIEAHGGFIDIKISPKSNTLVIIHLPMQGIANE